MSPLAFRNVEVSPQDPVSQWPLEAVQTALERGGRADWRRLANAIEAVLTYSRPYGIAMAFERVISRSRKAAETAERAAVAAEIDRLVRKSGLSRAEFASRVGTSAPRLSTYVNGKVIPSAALMVRMHRTAGKRRASNPIKRPM